MKNLLIFVTVITFSYTAAAQNCYVRLDDASGYTPTASQLAELEAAACRLIDSLPAAFRDSFRVYDFGFYLHNETQQGGYPEAFQWAVDTVQTLSKYYLLFGKQTDRSGVYTRFWVDLRLPETGAFSCIDQTKQMLFKESIALKMVENYSLLENALFRYVELEILGMKYLESVFNSIVEQNCCPFSRTEIEGILLSKGYDMTPAYFMDIPISAKTDAPQIRLSGAVENYANLLCQVQGVTGYENFEYTLIDEISNASSAGINAKGYITKNENICESIGYKIINGFDDDVYFHLHFSPNPDSLIPGTLFTKIKKKVTIEQISLPEVIVTGTGNCNAPYPLPDPVQLNNNSYQWSPPFNYAITINQDQYHGFHSVNGAWQVSDSVEYTYRKPLDPNENDHTWADKGARREYLGFPFRYRYYPSYDAWRRSETPNAQYHYPTQGLENKFYLAFYPGTNFLAEKYKIFQQLKYANFQPPSNHNTGTSFNWDCNSTVSQSLHDVSAVSEGLNEVKTVMKNWLKTHDDFDGLFLNKSNWRAPNTNVVNLSHLHPLWAFQAFGWTQGIKVQVKKLKRVPSPCFEGNTPGTKSYEVEFIYTIYDIFGNGQSDGAKWWFPGLVELWILQHYRNFDCDHMPCYIPITTHSVTIVETSILCITN